MDRTDPNLGLLLARAEAGTATPAELAELERALVAFESEAPLGLRDALDAEVGAVADGVFGALDVEAAFVPVAAALAEAVRAPTVDVAEAVLAGLDHAAAMEIMVFADGEAPAEARPALAARLLRDADARAAIAAQAELGAGIREGVAAAPAVDAWPAVAEALGVDPWHVEGWDATAAALRAEVAARPPVDVAGAVIARLPVPRREMPRWLSLGVPVGVLAAAAAALVLVLVNLPTVAPRLADSGMVPAQFLLASVNDAHVEALETAPDVQAQVLQFEDGGPTIIFVDDGPAPSGSSL